jgi:phage terminase large subunit-like protein
MFDQKLYPNCFKAHSYALDVLSLKIPASIYIQGACRRYIRDIKREDLFLDFEWAEKFMRMFQNFEHVAGIGWKSRNIILEQWQCFLYLNVEGFYWEHTGKRKYKEAYLEVARGNGKSTKLSVTGLIYLSLYKDVIGNKVYCCAVKRDQAKIVLNAARQMAKKNTSYLKHTGTEVFAHYIAQKKSDSEFLALASDSKSLDGLNPILCIIDELHSHKTRALYDVLSSAMIKRNDSLLFCITTAGFSLDGIGYSQSLYAKKVAIGEIEDESFFSLVYTLDENDDWRDEHVWIKANPNLGVSTDKEALKAKAFKAINNPQDEVNFKVKNLNLWQNAASQYFDVKKWVKQKCDLKFEDFKGEECFIGIDLASKVDLTSIAYVFKKDENFYFFTDNFIPKAKIDDNRNAMYIKWEKNGELIVTEGEAINYPKLQERFLQNALMVMVNAAHYDPWNATEFAQRVGANSIEMKEFRMNVSNMSEPMKMLDALIREGRAFHNGSELVTWTLGNVVAKVDANDNVYPRKEHESMKIDPIVAMIMALAGWIQLENEKSIYEERGMIFF